MKSVALHNLGCKVNSYEIEVMQQMLQEKGYTIVPFDETADIYIVNTCTVTNIADRKSRQMLHRAKQKNPAALVVAVGCYVQTGREDVEQDPCIDLAIGNNRKKNLASILEEYLQNLEQEDAVAENAENAGHGVDKTLHDTTVIDINHTAEYEEMTLKQTAEHTRAYIKIQDGCNQFCSYCVIPYARGRVRSRRAEDIIREITGMAQNGYREIVLTGIHISSYGIDFDEEAWKRGESVSVLKEDEERRDYSGSSKLIDLLERIHTIEGIERIRIGSLEPRIITEETAARMAALPKLCPHFHLSLQSGCDATLRRMNRKYTSEEYAESVALLRKVFDHPAITTDVIVGFPGETEEEFAQTKEFLDRIQFFEMHIFKYSKRAGTRAAVMSHQVPDPVKTTRSAELLAMEKEQSKQFRTHYVGREAEVLLEETKEIGGTEYLLGHTRDYVKLAVSVKENKKNVANTVICGRVQGFLTDEILLLSPLEFSSKCGNIRHNGKICPMAEKEDRMQNLGNTQYFKVETEPETGVKLVLSTVYEALTEKGYNPVNQIVGYIMSGDPTYITSHKNARSLIMKVERDELVEELLTEYIRTKHWK